MISASDVILVTGGAGYIGSHVCKALRLSGYHPVTYDNLETGHRHAVRWGAFEPGDILDQARLTQVMLDYRCLAVIHLAAYTSVAESVAQPERYRRNHVDGGACVLAAMRAAGISQMVFSSSAAVYGEAAAIPIREDALPKPINPYGAAKWEAEQQIHAEAANGVRAVILRYFNVTGADADMEIGCEQHQPTQLVPKIMDVLGGRAPMLEIYGTDYATADGTAIRDYVHVSDVANAHVLALEALQHMTGAMTVNLGAGRGFSVREVVQAAQDASGMQVAVALKPRRVGDPAVLLADSSLARRMLGWKPAYEGLDAMLETAWGWENARR